MQSEIRDQHHIKPRAPKICGAQELKEPKNKKRVLFLILTYSSLPNPVYQSYTKGTRWLHCQSKHY